MPEPVTILVADDDAGMRESVSRALRREGFQALLAEDGTAALECLRLDRLDVIHAGAHTFPLTDRIRAVAIDRVHEDVHPLD